jgi:transposase
MEMIHPRCAGIDVSKKDAKVCVRVQARGSRSAASTVTTWGAVTGQILDLKEYLLKERVGLVVMEAASDYWCLFYYLLEDEGLDVILANARDARNVPERKTDVSDAAWLADLGARGLVRASFVPPPPIRELRDLTRARTIITLERTREIQRLEKLLEDACIKLSSVASDITGVSGRLMLQALIEGQDDPAALAELAQRRMRSKIPELTNALTGRFSSHHRYMAELYLHRIDAHTADIDALSTRVEEAIAPFRLARELLVSIPGFSTTIAEIFIAETGADMTVFPSAGHLASWAGTSPGSNESAGRVKSTKTRPGNRYRKGALGIESLSAARSKNTYFSAR